ncbi:unnamed protein product [Schistocephalus solidus]|uniref:Protein kinase domain-containing protein n=1 Tax=Schistocephalus solidus TaxID=70667 RepID=A0A183T6Y5_SCHSO|nr:unnamed protein product [Schistocephalus solidus]
MRMYARCGECSFGRLYLVPNSHLRLLEAGYFPAAISRSTAPTGELNQMMVSGVLCVYTPGPSAPSTLLFPLSHPPCTCQFFRSPSLFLAHSALIFYLSTSHPLSSLSTLSLLLYFTLNPLPLFFHSPSPFPNPPPTV